MKEVVTHVYCDRVDIHGAQEPGSEVLLLNSKAKPVAVDLCDVCKKSTSLVEAAELADAVGQPADLPSHRGRPRGGQKPSPGPCDIDNCGAEFTTAQGLAMHKNRTHGIKGATK